MKNFFFLLFLAITAVVFGAPVVAFAQDTLTLDPAVPGSYTDPGNVGMLTVAVTTILAYLSGVFPGLRNIKAGYLRTGIVSFIVLIGAATFKLGFLNENSVQFILDNFFPNFAYAGMVWEAIKFVARLLGTNLKNLSPAG